MAYLNKVMLIGNLGKDPEIRVNQQTGRKSVSFSIATSRRYRDNNGEQKEDTQWHNVEGRLTNRSWTDQASGQKRYVTEVALDTFQLLTPRGNGQANGNEYGQQAQQHGNTYPQPQAPSDDEDIDLPF